MEAVTAFVEGPLCFVILYGMLKQKSWRFTLQFAVSLGQFYGDVLYFATSWYDGTLVSLVMPILTEARLLWSWHISTLCTFWARCRAHVKVIRVLLPLSNKFLLILHNIGITVSQN